MASRAPDALVSDQFAAPLVRTVGIDFFARAATGELDPGDLDGLVYFDERTDARTYLSQTTMPRSAR